MKVTVVGGGPAGLYFALLLKQQDAAHRITLLERNPADVTFGWGVVFSAKTLNNLAAGDVPSHDALRVAAETWDSVVVVHRDQKIMVRGNHFAAIARISLLQILQRRCRELGVEIKFQKALDDVAAAARDCDLLIGADGVNSTVRTTFNDAFQPTIEPRRNKYIWLGTRERFDGLTLTFRESQDGVFTAHSYRYSPSLSTFIVECSEETWRKSKLDRFEYSDGLKYLEAVFARDLGGHELLSNNSRWTNFPIVRNAHWHHGNVVLLGDALHTAHFSIGSGTKLALEDAVALADCFTRNSDVGDALADFERVRKPVVDEYQRAALESLLVFESIPGQIHLEPLPLAYKLMTRSSKVDHENLRQRDPEFVAAYEAWLREHGAAKA